MDVKYLKEGKPLPLGATITDEGVNFALFSQHALRVTLCFLDIETKQIIARVPLHPEKNKTGYVWHVLVKELKLPVIYGYRVDGSHNSPYYYDPKILLVDPYAKILDTTNQWGKPRTSYHPYGVVMKQPSFDWQGVYSPNLKQKDLVIYEMHVRGFTEDPSSKVKNPGTFLGMIEKIPYLLDLGINAVELMPIQEFNECGNDRRNPNTQEKLYNYWGYSSLNFFSPMMRYSASSKPGDVLIEFKTMVREMHRNGIEVILDVVFNHTGEKRGEDKLLSFVGIDRTCYYLLSHGLDTNYTGCGNTMNTTHPMTQHFLIDCLHYWVEEMQVDGFRFDLASIFNRDTQGNLLPMSSLIGNLSYDPVLAKTKLIAEPWDAAGAYQLGSFFPFDSRWSEWNGQYRDCIRKFIKGDHHIKNNFAGKIAGSQSIFPLRKPQSSLNFITSHDGFTLSDLVSYEKKHNIANGESNKDGNDSNESWNHGCEGATQDEKIITLRTRQRKNFILALLVSQGIPMIFMGDEYGHTKGGNNNTWCQDGKINWFLWDEQLKNVAFYKFVRRIIQFRHDHPILKKETFLKETDIDWHGINLLDPHWGDGKSLLACRIHDQVSYEDIYIAFNATSESVVMNLPSPPEKKLWYVVADTSAASPQDYFEIGKERVVTEPIYQLLPYSSLLLKAL